MSTLGLAAGAISPVFLFNVVTFCAGTLVVVDLLLYGVERGYFSHGDLVLLVSPNLCAAGIKYNRYFYLIRGGVQHIYACYDGLCPVNEHIKH